jgi:hypothetical protein
MRAGGACDTAGPGQPLNEQELTMSESTDQGDAGQPKRKRRKRQRWKVGHATFHECVTDEEFWGDIAPADLSDEVEIIDDGGGSVIILPVDRP